MGTEELSPKYDLTDFNFHQLIEVVAKASSANLELLENTLLEDSLYLFSSNPKISFPLSDIEKVNIINRDNKTQFNIVVNFLGLQGSSGPLPGSVLDEIAEEFYESEHIKIKYLDFFNHHLISLLHQIWRKYKYYIKFKEDFSDIYSKNMMSLIGISREYSEYSHLKWDKIFYYLGIIQSRIRTPQVLSTIIQYYFSLDKVEIKEHARQLVQLDSEQRSSLGNNNMMLGDDFIAGDVVESFSNKFDVAIHNLDISQFYQFLPLGHKYTELKELIRFLLKDPLPYDISLGLHPQTHSTFVLGENKSSLLGWTTLLNSAFDNSYYLDAVTIEGQR
ncbi:type VI secretion system baseplate subunit TssG [Aggregatibacter aphrophilus]|jgi:type VI secretion protein, VC_A0111 family|uniref:Type VI secretion protein n=1 Tax=Aggregatibacter aphrophilus TaxID=732 RepID=A0AAP7GW80_AGGAP|nr:type VI secretion system baseplate subunit TssG [Aggregatibacter aphrophilus]OBY51378.1 type VI secretion protein [Aggregatibacter aphrophilus]